MRTVNIVCLKWGTKYSSEYVNKLYFSVKRNLTKPFVFHCFTENSNGINDEIVIHDLPFAKRITGWWNKLYLFSSEMPIKGKILFLDLDTVITGNIDDVVEVEGFVALRDFYASMAKGVSTTDMGSGLMSWNTEDDYSVIWNRFIRAPHEATKTLHPHGDQRWIQLFVYNRKYWQDELPNQIVSFKCHCADGLPPDARIICYHGVPSIPESIKAPSKGWRGKHIPKSEWVKEYWR